MRKRTKQHGLSMLAGLLMMAMLAGWMLSGPFEVEAATEVASSDALFTAISGDSDIDVDIKLTGNIAVSKALVWGKNSTLTIDLNGCTLSGENNSGVLELTSGTLTITDSSEGNGTITSTASSVGTIEVTGGTLNITGGSIQSENYVAVNADSNMNADSKTTVTVENGTLEGNFAALKIGNNCSATIGKNGGNPKLQSKSDNGGNSTIIMQPSETASDSIDSSELVILGGEFLADTEGDYCYVCSVSGENNKVTISGGTFTLNADVGSTLVIGADMKDSNVSISGGIYNGRIARMISEGTEWDYSAYYGGGTFGGIISNGFVLTDNYFHDSNRQPTVFTADKVSVVPGSLLKFNTRRSSLETYTESEAVIANRADLFSINPISVGTNGTVYANSNANEIPTVDASKISNGNTYTFQHWIDGNNRIYASSADYLVQNSMAGSMGNHVTLYAVWKANCSSPEGLQSAANCSVVSEVSGSFELKSETEYTLGAGSWTVTGDNTVYSGGQSFYVTESGNYGFQRR